jgi:hypothetical protein
LQDASIQTEQSTRTPVRAVRRESNQAVARHWGVTAQTVTAWRRALDVPRGTKGTRQLHRDWTPETLSDAARQLAEAVVRSPERIAKIRAAKLGKPRPRHVIEAMDASVRQHNEQEGLAVTARVVRAVTSVGRVADGKPLFGAQTLRAACPYLC